MPGGGQGLLGGGDATCRRRTRRRRPQWRSTMPERSRIHSSDESMRSTISALVTTRAGGSRRRRGCGRAAAPVGAARARWRLMRVPPRGAGGRGLAGGDRVAVLDEPLDDVPPCGAMTATARRAGSSTVPTGVAGLDARRRAADARRGGRCPWPGPRASATSGLGDRARRAVPGDEVAGGLEVVRGLQRERLDAGSAAWPGRPGCRPAAARSAPVTPRSRMVCMQRSQRTGFATWSTSRRARRGRRGRRRRRAFESRRVRGSWVVTARGEAARASSTAGCHVLGVEGAGDLQRDAAARPRGGSACEARRAARACRRRRSGRRR